MSETPIVTFSSLDNPNTWGVEGESKRLVFASPSEAKRAEELFSAMQRALTAERERADKNQKDAERLCSLLDATEINGDHFTWRRRNRKPVDALRDEMDAIFGIDSARRK